MVIDALDLEAAYLLDFPDSVETLKFVFQQFMNHNKKLILNTINENLFNAEVLS